MLYELAGGTLTSVPGTTFADEQVLERTHLQAALRDNIGVLDADLLVVAEEFGHFEDTTDASTCCALTAAPGWWSSS